MPKALLDNVDIINYSDIECWTQPQVVMYCMMQYIRLMAKQQNKTTAVQIRVAPEQKRLMEDAASLSGQSLSAFVTSNALEAARQVVSEQSNLVLSNRDRDLFLDLLDNPPEPGERLKQAAQRHLEADQD